MPKISDEQKKLIEREFSEFAEELFALIESDVQEDTSWMHPNGMVGAEKIAWYFKAAQNGVITNYKYHQGEDGVHPHLTFDREGTPYVVTLP
jgi:hypothetical protein